MLALEHTELLTQRQDFEPKAISRAKEDSGHTHMQFAGGGQPGDGSGAGVPPAKVWLNGHRMGVSWKRPHQYDVTPWARPGKNFLEVRVSNRLINAVGGMKKPDWTDQVAEKYAG